LNLMKTSGFTLIEVLLTVTILGISVCGILLTYVNMFMLSDLSRDMTLATNALQARMEEIKREDFETLSSLHGTPFDLSGFSANNAKGRVEVYDVTLRTPPTETLKRIRLVACFRTRGRLLGEDSNLDGAFDAGEDLNGNGRMDGPVELVTIIAR
jgi:prepilin-type N-terminal cleavage/methylation domain-containing protein